MIITSKMSNKSYNGLFDKIDSPCEYTRLGSIDGLNNIYNDHYE